LQLREVAIDRLADAAEASLDVDRVLELLDLPVAAPARSPLHL
jgi:hypothetical protein